MKRSGIVFNIRCLLDRPPARAMTVVFSGLLIALTAKPAYAQSVEAFYKSHPITMLVGSGAGGGYDVYARTFARFWSNHIPGHPDIIAKDMPAAAGLAAASTLYANAARDGSVIGAFTNGAAMDPLFGNPGAHFDALKFNTAIVPNMLNTLIGTKFKVISGYDPGSGLTLAVESGEAEGICGLSWSTMKASRPRWISEHLLNVIVQMGLKKLAELPDVPSALDLVSDPQNKRVMELILMRQEVGRPFAAPPDTPPDRVAALRQAFDATLADPAFIAEAGKTRLEIDPLTGQEIATMLAKAYAAPKLIVARAAALVEPNVK